MIRRPNETVTQFSMRLIRNEILEQVIQAADNAKDRDHYDVIYNGAIDSVIKAIRALQQE